MAAQVETMTAADEGQGTLTKGEQERMLEFEKIIKFRDTITSGKHPRIKVPVHLLPANPGAVTSSPPRPSASRPNVAHDASVVQPAELDTSKGKQQPRNALAHQDNSQQSAGMVAFPGLGLVPTAPAAMTARAIAGGGGRELAGIDRALAGGEVVGEPIVPVHTQFSLRRADLEKALLEQGKKQASKDNLFKESLPDFDINDVWQKGLACERTFTPVPVALGGVANAKGTAAAAAASIIAGSDRNDSTDDKTFYSSNFSTPEFGLTSRIPIESGNDDVSMEDSSDYEPELDIVPSPVTFAQPLPASRPGQLQTQPQPQLQAEEQHEAGARPVQVPTMHSPGYPVPLPPIPSQGNTGPSNPTGLQPQWNIARVSGQTGTTPGEAVFRQAGDEPQQPPSPFVRAHNLSPVAPQPTHAAALAVEQLSSALQRGQLESQATPAQIAVLRREQAVQSSPDSSPQTAGSRATDKKKGSKRSNKRKADQAAIMPNIKQEPRSPSPIVVPPAQRAPKRQRHAARHGHDGGRAQNDQDHAVRGSYATPLPPLRDDRVPVVYERAAPERYVRVGGGVARPVDLPQEQRPLLRDWEVYDTRQPNPVPQFVPAVRPPSGPLATHYAPEQTRADMRPVRAASHALVEVSSGYSRPSHGGYASVYDSGRVSVRPEPMILTRSGSPIMHTRSPAMAPPASRIQFQHPQDLAPPPPPAAARVVVDEYGREYYEPAKYAVRQPAGPRYDAELIYERVAPLPLQQSIRAGSQMPLAYEDDRAIYRRTSPTFVQPRRVLAQPEYATYEAMGGVRQREYSALPGSRPGEEYANPRSPPPPLLPPQYERRHVVEEPQREYMIRASTARPPEPLRYEVAQPGGYMERVGSVRPPDAVPLGLDFSRVSYDSRHREQPTVSAYIGSSEPVARDYSGRPEQQQQQQQQQHQHQQQQQQQAVLQRPFSVRPGPAPYYVEQPEGGPMPGYVYPNGVRRDVYR